MNTPPEVIRSRDNALVKRVVRLAESARDRSAEGVAVLEGWHLIRACLEAPGFGMPSLERILVCESILPAPETRAMLDMAESVPVTVVAEPAFSRLGPVDGPNAVVALMTIRSTPFRDPAPAQAFELWLEDVQDPGNVGTLIRTAAAAGVTHVRLSPGCADPWSPKVLRAGMGGQFAVPIDIDSDLVGRARAGPVTTYAFALAGTADLYEEPIARPLALILGNEGSGLGAALSNEVDRSLRIPMPGAVESLNVAAAGAVALFEVVRRERGVASGGTVEGGTH